MLDLLDKYNARSISELYDKCAYFEWEMLCEMTNYHELLKTGLELYIKRKLCDQRENMWDYALKLAHREVIDLDQYNEIHKIFVANGINACDFRYDLEAVLKKSEFKINSMRFVGIPNSGKSLIANCIVEPFICCYMNNHGSENEFFMSNMLNKSIILCEELYITIATAEDFKSVLGGQPLDIAKKFNEKQLLSRTPVIITSNYERFGRGHLPPMDELALRLRCYNYEFKTEIRPMYKITWPQLYLYLERMV